MGVPPKKFQIFSLKSFVNVSIGKFKCMIGLTGVWAWAELGNTSETCLELVFYQISDGGDIQSW